MRPSRMGGLALAAAAAVASCQNSCPDPYPFPGVQIVTFEMTATPAAGGLDECADAGYAEIPDASFNFRIIFSGDEDGTIHSMTIQESVRDNATWDGVLLHSTQTAPRYFDLCGDGGVDEELFIAPITHTQSLAIGEDRCPTDPTARGAIPVDLDAGIRPPGWFNGHFDAVRGCGILSDTVHEAGDKPCPTCTMHFDLKGPRL